MAASSLPNGARVSIGELVSALKSEGIDGDALGCALRDLHLDELSLSAVAESPMMRGECNTAAVSLQGDEVSEFLKGIERGRSPDSYGRSVSFAKIEPVDSEYAEWMLCDPESEPPDSIPGAVLDVYEAKIPFSEFYVSRMSLGQSFEACGRSIPDCLRSISEAREMADADYIEASELPSWTLSQAAHFASGYIQEREFSVDELRERFAGIDVATLFELSAPVDWIKRFRSAGAPVRAEWVAIYPQSKSTFRLPSQIDNPHRYDFTQLPYADMVEAYLHGLRLKNCTLAEFALGARENTATRNHIVFLADKHQAGRDYDRLLRHGNAISGKATHEDELASILVDAREYFDNYPAGLFLDSRCRRWIEWGARHGELTHWLSTGERAYRDSTPKARGKRVGSDREPRRDLINTVIAAAVKDGCTTPASAALWLARCSAGDLIDGVEVEENDGYQLMLVDRTGMRGVLSLNPRRQIKDRPPFRSR